MPTENLLVATLMIANAVCGIAVWCRRFVDAACQQGVPGRHHLEVKGIVAIEATEHAARWRVER